MVSAPKCKRCSARMRVASSRSVGREQLQYLACISCSARERRFVPAEQIWRRGK
jgi:hypothetical protein